MPGVSQVEWLNQNSLRNYPIRENAQRKAYVPNADDDVSFELPNYLITDFVMSVAGEASYDIYIKKLALVATSMTVVLGSKDSDLDAATIHVDLSEHVVNTGYRFMGINDYSDAVGCIVIGDTSKLKYDLPDGVYDFSFEDTCFEYRCVRPSVRKVSSISIVNTATGYQSNKLVGDVKLMAGANIELRYDKEKNAVWISAKNNAGYSDTCECGAETTVKTINGISVENVTLVGDDCVSVSKKGKTIHISDKCSKPCCGCAELDFINEKIAQINTSINKLDTYTGVIDNRLTELQASYEQSSTGDAN